MTIETELLNEPLVNELAHDHVRTRNTVNALQMAFADNLFYLQGKHPISATKYDLYMALAYCIRDRIFHKSLSTVDAFLKQDFKIVCYFSAEYLMGPQLGNNMTNLGITKHVYEALKNYKINTAELIDEEPEPGLGNGGLGRLAACYLDSLATLNIPSIGYGIRYEFGMFEQQIRNGWQVEKTDKWLSLGNPWEIPKPERAYNVNFGGYTSSSTDDKGHFLTYWTPSKVIKGVAYDTPIVGYNSCIGNVLRLWKAEATESFDFDCFNVGDYYRAVEEKMCSENITKVLYPNDSATRGKQLRLEQQYFFVSCSLQDMIQIHLQKHSTITTFHETFAGQLNDTHPSIAIAELMRLLVDVHHIDWDTAWTITTKTFAYTNHTLMPEALEKWSVSLFASLLPRHLEIIYEINRRFLNEVKQRYPGDIDRLRRMSLIDESGDRYVRMAHLACVGSHAINGVAALHTKLLKTTLLPDFVDLWPGKFLNITNGVTPRRFMLLSDPSLSELISSKIGTEWVKDLTKLKELEPFAKDPTFQEEWRQIKHDNKVKFAKCIKEHTEIIVSPDSMFDVQIKRIHEYKRQHLNALYLITLYNRIKRNPKGVFIPRTAIFGGKAAPGYAMAKLIIKLITSIGDIINNDPDVRNLLKVVFFPNYNVKNGQKIFAAADLSEQISLAGKEASGTGNMKLAMNGALTIGTFDGANIEIREQVGEDNFFLFGLTARQSTDWKQRGYTPYQVYASNPELVEAIDMLRSGVFSKGDKQLFSPLVDNLLYQDPFMVLADYAAYVACQDKVNAAYQNPAQWTKMSILNVARMGMFSSDRAIHQYNEKIWNAKSL
jgi:starch phosphorylase